jgi:beta-phosphoglucomutase
LIIAILWDFDGVVVFTPHEEAWRLVSLKYGIVDFTSEFYHKYVSGRPRYEGAKAILEYFGLIREQNVNSALSIILEFAEEKNRVFNDLISKGFYYINNEALKFIKSTRSYKHASLIHVLASASRNVSKLADNITYEGKKLRDYFDYDVSGSASTKKEVFEKALEVTDKADCHIVIDDAPSGIEAARAIGAIPIGFRNSDLSKWSAVLVINSFKEVSSEVIIELCKTK